MKRLLFFLLIPVAAHAQLSPQDTARCHAEALSVSIIRDNWGIPHIYAKTDAGAVFGCLYAQCEENYEKVEDNNLELLGRLAEKYGSGLLYQDLQMKLIYDTAAAKNDYRDAPGWFRKLLDAAADGVNYFLYTHPRQPRLLTRFEPWWALLRTNGSISATQTGGLSPADMKRLYDLGTDIAWKESVPADPGVNESGSNGFAVAPSRTLTGNAIIYINPHVTFYYRDEMHLVSNEGLNAYGAVTWGTFFVFQGFNAHCGWMHTSSYADVADLYLEKIEKRNDSLFYLYDGVWKPARMKTLRLAWKKNDQLAYRDITTYATGHGPVMGSHGDGWLSLKENNRSLKALMQSWLRTKANDFEEFRTIMDMRSNSSDNTVFADDHGHIAYWHGNFIPVRDTSFDWTLPVDGTTSATEWKGIHRLDEIVHIYDPQSGWIENCNSTPFTASGSSSPQKEKFPSYMAPDAENYRAITAQRLLAQKSGLTVDRMISEIGYSHYLSAFEILLQPLFAAFDRLPGSDSLRQVLTEPVSLLRQWNRESSDTSIATTLATEWVMRTMKKNADTNQLTALLETMRELDETFGSWKIPWGDLNRYQRPVVNDQFNDNSPSLPCGLASSFFGSIPSFVSRRFPGTKRRYGYSGNSFVACVEFGKKVKAKSVVTGGESFDPTSKNFTDQAKMYIDGKFKDVLFYKQDVLKHAARIYHPGQ